MGQYRGPTVLGTICSLIAHLALGGAIGFILGIFIGQPIIGAGLVAFISLGDFGRGFNKTQKAFQETQKMIMLKHQSGVPLNPQEQALWETMNGINQGTKAKKIRLSRNERKALEYRRLATNWEDLYNAKPHGFWAKRYKKLARKHTKLACKYEMKTSKRKKAEETHD